MKKIINGSLGEGGGQIFRTALSLAMCQQVPIKIYQIRSKRKKPGLLRQHLACLRACQQITGAQVTGDELGSTCVEFIPGKIQAGDYEFAIGTAGSTTLLFQTILPALLLADTESTITLRGGTHNDMAPSYHFLCESFLPILAKMNIRVDTDFCGYGFYPNGGGQWHARIFPAKSIAPLELLERGNVITHNAQTVTANLPAHIAQRELQHIRLLTGWSDSVLQQRKVRSPGPGNIVSLRITSEHVTQVFDEVGKLQVKSEQIAENVVNRMQHYLNTNVAVDEYLCDQLLLPMALGRGGHFTTPALSLHSTTNIAVIQQFLSCDITAEACGEEVYRVTVGIP